MTSRDYQRRTTAIGGRDFAAAAPAQGIPRPLGRQPIKPHELDERNVNRAANRHGRQQALLAAVSVLRPDQSGSQTLLHLN